MASIIFAPDGRDASPAPRVAVVFLPTIVTTALGGLAAWYAVRPDGVRPPEVAGLVLFVLCFAWIALSFWTAVPGFVNLLARRPVTGLAGPRDATDARGISSRVAMVVPVRNEDPHTVFAGVRAIGESIGRSHHPELIDFFVLSDSDDPDVLVAEELAWTELRGALSGICEVFYRRRADNGGKKAGNLAEFCRRWGAAYDYFIVLDADSVMEADTIITMTRVMELNPSVGILQAPPVAVGGRTRFARFQQFAAFAYGSVVTAGMSSWQGGASNYWGHNAIIRTAAFARYCGLPVLSGTGPFSGEILSHDFVEAALMRRAGFEVWMLPALRGSYERLPPTLFDFARRDRRWCAGNLQHLRLVATSGLHPLSRLHLILGAMSYLVSPLWLLFILAGVLASLDDAATPAVPGVEPVVAGVVFAASTLLVFSPRLMGVVVVLRDRDIRRALGGGAVVVGSGAAEILVSALLAPVTMVMQTAALGGILAGSRTAWGAQRREGEVPTRGELARAHWPHLLLAVVLGGTAVLVPGTAPWLAFMIASLLSAPALSVWTAGTGSEGSLLGRLLRTPEETAPASVLVRAEELRRSPSPVPVDGLRRVVLEPRAHAVHLAVLDSTDGDVSAVPDTVARLILDGDWDRIGYEDRMTALASADFLRGIRLRLHGVLGHGDRRSDDPGHPLTGS